MLREVRGLHGLLIHAQDGVIGKVDEILFDDQNWTVRYLVVDTGGWLTGRKVLISPIVFEQWDWTRNTLTVKLSRKQIENSPGVETDQPVSRQFERAYYDYYALPYYWGGMGGWGEYGYPGGLYVESAGNTTITRRDAEEEDYSHDDAHLRSTKAVTGYGLSATDGHIGHIEDFIVDDGTWRIRYFAVDTRDLLSGKTILLPPDWISAIDWLAGSVSVGVTRDQVKHAPEWEKSQPISRMYEEQLHRYYDKQEPWLHGKPSLTASSPKVSKGEQRKTEPVEGMPTSAVVALYDTHDEAEKAVRALQQSGFDMRKLSIVGKNYQTSEEVVGYYNTGDRMMEWGTTGAFWGGMWSLLFGSAFFLMPGIGPFLAAGPVVAWIVGALESAVVVGGISALGAALAGIGIPENSILLYETQIKAGKFVVIAHETPFNLDKAKFTLESTQHNGIELHLPIS